MMRPIVSTIFTVMCHSNAPLQTKSDMEIQEDFGDDAANDADTENLFTCATQVRKEKTLFF
jgi:hypothetical protein